MALYYCQAQVLAKSGAIKVGMHDTVKAAHECAILNLALRDRGIAEEAAILLHPELKEDN